MTLRALIVILTLSCALAVAGDRVARAQTAADVAAARELYVEGAALSKEGKWRQAEDRFSRSLQLKQAPITHYMLAVAQQNTGKLVDALENFRAFLAAPEEPATASLREPAKQAADELANRVAKVSIAILPADLRSAVVTLDGVEVPRAARDRARLVDPGQHELQARAEGWTEASKTFSVGEGETISVMLQLERVAPGTSAAAPAPAPGQPMLGVTPPPADAAGPGAEAPDDDSAVPVAPLVLLAGGAVVAGVGVTVGLIGVGEAEDAPTNDGTEAEDARAKSLAGDVLAGVGIAAAAVGLVWLIADAASGSGDAEVVAGAARLRPWAARSVAGLEVAF